MPEFRALRTPAPEYDVAIPGGGLAGLTLALQPHDNFQIDRGRFENELAARARRAGADLLQGWRVGDIDLGADGHAVAVSHQEDQLLGLVDSVGVRPDQHRGLHRCHRPPVRGD